MDARFLRFYEEELAHIRQTAAEFAREFPKIAGRLQLDPDGKEVCPDPFVERLLEGYAFLAARVQLKFAAEFPTFTQTLLEIVYPHYLCPTPAMTVVRFDPDMAEGSMAEGHPIKRGTALRSHPGGKSATACEFRTAHDVTLWPLKIAEARYYTTREMGELSLPDSLGAKGAVRVSLEAANQIPLSQIKADSLVFHLRGAGEIPVNLYENLFARAAAVFVGYRRGNQLFRHRLPDRALKQRGLDESDALLPVSPRSFDGYRLLREYFSLPHRLLFFELGGLKAAFEAVGTESECELIFTFDDQDFRLEGKVDRGCFELFCTPAINLFPRRCDRVPIDARSNEYPVIADRTRTLDYEVYQIESVAGVGARAEEEQVFAPFYRSTDRSGNARVFFEIQRRTRVLTAREREFGAVSEYPGTEVWLSLVDALNAPFHPDLKQLAVTALCTNRHLPIQMPVGTGTTDFHLDTGAPVLSVRCLVPVTPPRPSHVIGEHTWRIISHLSLNYLSLADHRDGQGAVALRELVKLYADMGDPTLRRQVEGVRSVSVAPVVRRVLEAGPVAFARGLEMRVKFRESDFRGTGVFLLGAVLERFFSKYTSINSFTETVIATEERGEIVRWPTRLGIRDTL